MRALRGAGYALGPAFAEGPSRFRGLCRLAPGRPVRQLDLLFVDRPEAFPFALLAYTGDRGFTIALRRAARERGLSLSERGLAPEPPGRRFESERDVFAALGVPYVPPSRRITTLD